MRNAKVCLDLELAGFFDEGIDAALQSGLPATLVVQWRIWRLRNGWWDEEVTAGSAYFRIFYDVLDQRYDVFDHTGRPLTSSDDLSAVEGAICSRRGLDLIRADKLQEGRTYFVEVLVRLRALDEQDVENLESWLQGGSTGSGSLLSLISDRAVGWLRKFVGPDERKAWARTGVFTPPGVADAVDDEDPDRHITR